MSKLNFKKGDTVAVIAGKDKGYHGQVLRAYPSTNKVIVEKVNLVKKNQRPTQDNPNGGIKTMEAPIDASNVMLVCPECDKVTRVGHVVDEKGNKVRVCKKCKKTF